MATSGPGWHQRITPFAFVSSAAAAAVLLSAVLDAATSLDDGLGDAWTPLWLLVALALTATPLLLGAHTPRWAGFVGCIVFFAVTSTQMALTESTTAPMNNLVLYPIVACYLGWFFRPWIARLTMALGAASSAIAILVNPVEGAWTTWINIGFASVFCLESAAYLQRRWQSEITTDPLTGASNRKGLDERLRVELVRIQRTGGSLTIAILDVDGLKRVNDSLGHSAGDRLLIRLVATLRANLRPYDAIIRMGGDEFLLILPGMTLGDAAAALSRIRATETLAWSQGFAEARPEDTTASLYARADEELYRDKQRRSTRRL